jgi:hypothetical protein
MRHYLDLVKIALQMKAILVKYDSSSNYDGLYDLYTTTQI